MEEGQPLPTPKEIHKALKDLAHVVHSTATPERSRIVLPVDPYDKEDTDRLTLAAYQLCMERGLSFAYAGESDTKSQPWFLPQTSPGCKHRAYGNRDGVRFNPDMIKGKIPAIDTHTKIKPTQGNLAGHIIAGKHNPTKAFIKELQSGTIHNATKAYIGWKAKTSDLSMGQIFDDVEALLDANYKQTGKEDKLQRWHDKERAKLEEWYLDLKVKPDDEVKTDILDAITVIKNKKGKDMKWRWKPWIPDNKLMIFAAEGGSGKSSVLYDTSARETSKRKFPFSKQKGSGGTVLYITAEDDIEDTIKPRFRKAGGDQSKFIVLDSEKIHLDLVKDGIDYLQKIVDKYPDITMIILDPIDSYCGTVNTHMASVVKSIMGPVNSFARKNKITIIGVLHFKKPEGNNVNLKNMISGSASWVNSARLAVVAFEDPETEDKYMGIVKSNNGSKKQYIKYQIRIGKKDIVYINYVKNEKRHIQSLAAEILNYDATVDTQVAILTCMNDYMLKNGRNGCVITVPTRSHILSNVKKTTNKGIKRVLNRHYETKNIGGKWFYFKKD